MQSGWDKQLQKLSLRPHVDGLGDELAIAIVNKTLRDPSETEKFIYLTFWIEQYRITNAAFCKQLFHLRGLFVRDRKDHKSLILELLVQRFEVRHFLAAGLAPGGPEINQHNFAAQRLQGPTLSLQVSQRKINVSAAFVVRINFSKRRGELRIVDRCLHILVTHQQRELDIRRGRLISNHWRRLFAKRAGQRGRHFLQRVVAKVSFSRQVSKRVSEVELISRRQLSNVNCELFGRACSHVVGQGAQVIDLIRDHLFFGANRVLSLAARRPGSQIANHCQRKGADEKNSSRHERPDLIIICAKEQRRSYNRPSLKTSPENAND